MRSIQAAQAVGVHAPRRQLLEGLLRGMHVERVGRADRAIRSAAQGRHWPQAKVAALEAQHVRPARAVCVMINAVLRTRRGRPVEAVRQQRGATVVTAAVVAA